MGNGMIITCVIGLMTRNVNYFLAFFGFIVGDESGKAKINSEVFNIFGDTNQLMKSGRGISDWSLIMSEFNAEKYVLNENYRNTNQITRFCNENSGLKTLQIGVDGPKVREIPRRDLEKELAGLIVTNERIAILLPRTVQRMKYLNMDIFPENIRKIIGKTIDNGFIYLLCMLTR